MNEEPEKVWAINPRTNQGQWYNKDAVPHTEEKPAYSLTKEEKEFRNKLLPEQRNNWAGYYKLSLPLEKRAEWLKSFKSRFPEVGI